jgi:prepilin-type processing-associated H-X9-DG protein
VKPQRQRAASAFTLVELLLVIGIIALLIAVLLPALNAARAQSKTVRCAAQLQQIYHAQMAYADAHGGRVTPIVFLGADTKWPALLKRYVCKTDELPQRLFLCPTLDPDLVAEGAIAYGVNSSVMLPNWRMRRDHKCNSSQIILMGDKAASADDFLTTDNGYYLEHPDAEGGCWILSLQHNSHGSYRHGKNQFANMLMLDGHVTQLGRTDLQNTSPYWSFGGDTGIPTVKRNLGTCCPW